MADRVIQRNDTAARWQSINPVLAQGEMGIVSDGAKGYKIGDGVTAWNNLEYPANPASVVQEVGNSETAVMSQKAVTDLINSNSTEVKLNTNFFINFQGTIKVGSAVSVVNNIATTASASNAILYTYSVNKNEDYYLNSSWESGDAIYPLVVFFKADGSIAGTLYPNQKDTKINVEYTKIKIPEDATTIYVNSRYTKFGSSGLFKLILPTKEIILDEGKITEEPINLFDNSKVKDGICLVYENSNQSYLSQIEGYSIAIIHIKEEETYILSNYNCASKSVAILDKNMNIIEYKGANDSISSRITKIGDWEADDSPITINTIKGDKYIAFNVQRRGDQYYKVINTKIMLSNESNYTEEFVNNVELNYAKKLFNAGVKSLIPVDIVYNSYWDKDGNAVSNNISCRCEINVKPGTPLLINALPASARFILECDKDGNVIKRYNNPLVKMENFAIQDIIIVTSPKTKTVKISTTTENGITNDIKVYSLTSTASPIGPEIGSKKEVSILFIGNSLTQDAISYVPYLLRNIAPEIDFKLYIWYNGGKNLEEQYNEYFIAKKPCEIFSSSENSTSWININNSMTMEAILARYKFDVVCLQEYFNYKVDYTDSDITIFNNIINFIEDNYNYPFKVVTLFHQPKRDNAEAIFNLTLKGINKILSETITDDVLVPGIAIYDALSTSLNNLGNAGGLSPDGTHAQEGLPCLMQAYTIVIWLFDRLGILKSIANNKYYVTNSNYSSINVPGPNLGSGVIEGTLEQNKLAQSVAIKSCKKGDKIKLGL